ncbi:citrate lyase holo-[acyl-carrier protein] synthase [Neisseria musculi]|uniref:citrate lyase holo-[acyl-carrier protein] synthase n=1 Tax=Neisseria musculi TaxID=1815583 RepID=A0A7H1M8Q3_9NEIS|nr:citrate lyase holo-[acyl-carrier protein] synthase [Neisseria musculi]QNT58018.1 holo-ACP synthase CitX [Neisseria musculi]
MYSAPGFPPLIGSEVPLESVLAARDLRYAAQQALLAGRAASLVSFSVLAPGGVKRSLFLDEIFQTGYACLKQILAERHITISAEQHLDLKGGNSLLLAVDCAADVLKPLMMELEHQHPLGRLWDIDIIGGDGQPLSRSRFGLPPRACLCCGEPAKACARSRRHSLDELQTVMRDHYRRYREIVVLGGSMSAALCAEAELTPNPGWLMLTIRGRTPT